MKPSIRWLKAFSLDPRYRFKCGLEIHTQLKTEHKLFSNTLIQLSNEHPNSYTSYFDLGLPGTQPKLNPEAIYLALKTAVALGSDIQPKSTFDRKHYFYPDQPLGYQITQFYHPLAKNGSMELSRERDDIKEERKLITIQQIQLEQDTGKLTYDGDNLKIDYNRANMPLIELITNPDFENIEQVVLFVRKYQTLVKYLDICDGELENGSLRVDVNISVNGNNRVEIKNLNSFHDIQQALIFEYLRHITQIKSGEFVVQETRGWNGKETEPLRSKENAVDYRYVPDSELPHVYLDSNIGVEIFNTFPPLPDEVLQELTTTYQLELKYAKFLIANKDILKYYKDFCKGLISRGISVKVCNNWLFHELFGAFSKQSETLDLNVFPQSKLADLVFAVTNSKISQTLARILLAETVKNPKLIEDKTVAQLIDHLDLGVPEDLSAGDLSAAVEEICTDIMNSNPDVVAKVKKGQKKSIKYLVGLAMRQTQGKVKANQFQEKFEELIK